MSQRIDVLLNKLNKYETSHGWHFIASFFTGGLWIIMWILFSISNAIERGKIERQINKLLAAKD